MTLMTFKWPWPLQSTCVFDSCFPVLSLLLLQHEEKSRQRKTCLLHPLAAKEQEVQINFYPDEACNFLFLCWGDQLIAWVWSLFASVLSSWLSVCLASVPSKPHCESAKVSECVSARLCSLQSAHRKRWWVFSAWAWVVFMPQVWILYFSESNRAKNPNLLDKSWIFALLNH